MLYADDDSDDLDLVISSFEEYSNNVEVITFRDGTEILEYLDKLTSLDPKPCLIILDINMPTMDGIETLLQIRKVKEYRQIPVVLFSTSSNHLEKGIAESMGAHFITKPVRYIEIEKVVEGDYAHA